MKKLLSSFGYFGVAVILVLGPVWARADEIKIATVDMQKALQATKEGKRARAELESEFNKRKKELQAEEEKIKKLTDDFKKQSLVMNDEARAKKQGELQETYMKFQERTARSQQEIQERQAKLTKPIIDALKASISDLSKKKGYTLVLEKNENMVLYSQDKDDLTEEVISLADKQEIKSSEKQKSKGKS